MLPLKKGKNNKTSLFILKKNKIIDNAHNTHYNIIK